MEKQKKTILLLDDNPDCRILLENRLAFNGFDVVIGNDGIEGLEILRKLEPDLIILDVNMPRMNGVEFYNKILNDFGRPIYPVLVLTSRDELEGVFKSVDADGFIVKTAPVEKIIDKARNIISGLYNLNVFIIDSASGNAKHLEAIKKILIKARYNVFLCSDYPEFVKISESENKKVDFLLLEYRQKDITCKHLIEKIRFDGLADVPVLVYTFGVEPDIFKEKIVDGSTKYIVQPLDYFNFLRFIRDAEYRVKNK